MVPESSSESQNQIAGHVRLARAFFGKQSCLRFEFNGNGIWMMVGKKTDQAWDWKKAKMGASEVGDILHLLDGKAATVGFFHSFMVDGVKKENRINVSRAEEGQNLFFRIGEYAKPLMPGEQFVLRVMLERVLFEGAVDAWERGQRTP